MLLALRWKEKRQKKERPHRAPRQIRFCSNCTLKDQGTSFSAQSQPVLPGVPALCLFLACSLARPHIHLDVHMHTCIHRHGSRDYIPTGQNLSFSGSLACTSPQASPAGHGRASTEVILGVWDGHEVLQRFGAIDVPLALAGCLNLNTPANAIPLKTVTHDTYTCTAKRSRDPDPPYSMQWHSCPAPLGEPCSTTFASDGWRRKC